MSREKILDTQRLKREDALQRLATLRTDCMSQYNSLDQTGDVNWDCYDKGNWYSMVESIDAISKILIANHLKKLCDGTKELS